MRIAVLGRTSLLYNTLRLLEQAGHDIVLIGTCKAAPEYEKTEADFEKYSTDRKIPFFCNANLNDLQIASMLDEAKADIAVSINWVNIINAETIDRFKFGILNVHAGDLPRYRGNACPNWAIILREKEIAVCVHFMAPDKLDSGDILIKKYMQISSKTRIGEIYAWLEEIVPCMIVEAISGLENGVLIPQEQSKDTSMWLRVYPRVPADSLIDWRMNAESIERLINASSEPFAGAYTFYNLKKLIIWRAHAGKWDCPSVAVPGQVVIRDCGTGMVGIACGDGIISLEEVEVEGTRGKPYDVIKSMRARLGMIVEEEIFKLKSQLDDLINAVHMKDESNN